MPAEYPSEQAFSVEPFNPTDPEEPPVDTEDPKPTDEQDEQEAPFFPDGFWEEDDNE